MRCGFCTTLKYESFPKKLTFVSGQKSPHQTDHLLLSFLEPRGDPSLLIPSHSYLMFAPKIDLTTPFWGWGSLGKLLQNFTLSHLSC